MTTWLVTWLVIMCIGAGIMALELAILIPWAIRHLRRIEKIEKEFDEKWERHQKARPS